MKTPRSPIFAVAFGLVFSGVVVAAGGKAPSWHAEPGWETAGQANQGGTAVQLSDINGTWRLAKFGDRSVDDFVHLYLSKSAWFAVVEDPKSDDYVAIGGSFVIDGDKLKCYSADQAKERFPYFWLPDKLTDSAVAASGDHLSSEWKWLTASPRFTLRGADSLTLSGGLSGDKTLTFERLPETTVSVISGTWSPAKGDLPEDIEAPPETLVFGPDGAFASKKRTFGRETEAKGKFRISGGVLAVQKEGQAEENLYPFALYPFADNKSGSLLLLKPSSGKVWAFFRNDGSAGSGGSAVPPLAGSWVIFDTTGESRVTFSPDGTYTRETRQGGRVVDGSSGTWRIEGATLLVEDKQEGTTKLPFRLDNPDLLQLTIDGSPVIFKREIPSAGGGGGTGGAAGGTGGGVTGGGTSGGGTAGAGGTGGSGGDAGKTDAVKAALQATWFGSLENVYGIPSGSLTLTFLANGRFEGVWALGGGAAFPQTGKWKIAGSLLILENDFGPSTTLTFRLAGNTLTLDSFPTMRPAILYRQ